MSSKDLAKLGWASNRDAAAARAAALRASTKLMAFFCAEQRTSPVAGRADL